MVESYGLRQFSKNRSPERTTWCGHESRVNGKEKPTPMKKLFIMASIACLLFTGGYSTLNAQEKKEEKKSEKKEEKKTEKKGESKPKN
jgi:hypothetical protein